MTDIECYILFKRVAFEVCTLNRHAKSVQGDDLRNEAKYREDVNNEIDTALGRDGEKHLLKWHHVHPTSHLRRICEVV